MKDLNKKVPGGLPLPIIGLAALLFLPAWTLDYWQAWVLLAVFSMSMLAIIIYLMKMDPKLLERRVKLRAEKRRSQNIIKYCLVVAFIAMMVFPAIDHRFAWSSVPPCVVAAGDILVGPRVPHHIPRVQGQHLRLEDYRSRRGPESRLDRAVRAGASSDVWWMARHAFRPASRSWLVVGLVRDDSDDASDRLETS